MTPDSFRFKKVAVGGTFDGLHKGHRALLTTAFSVGESVVIGVTSDGFAKRLGKAVSQGFAARVQRVRKFVDSNFLGHRYIILPLEDYFGPATTEGSIDALVVGEEKAERANRINELRGRRGLKSLEVIVVPPVLANDGWPISTTRIRRGEIDGEGRILD